MLNSSHSEWMFWKRAKTALIVFVKCRQMQKIPLTDLSGLFFWIVMNNMGQILLTW